MATLTIPCDVAFPYVAFCIGHLPSLCRMDSPTSIFIPSLKFERFLITVLLCPMNGDSNWSFVTVRASPPFVSVTELFLFRLSLSFLF